MSENAQRKLEVLLVDDDDVFSTLLSELLRDSFYLTLASECKEASQLIDGRSFDIALLDLNLNGDREAGFALLSEITKKQSDCRSVMISGLDHAGTISKAISLGASDFVSKENDADEIISRVKVIAQQIHTERENLVLRDMLGQSKQDDQIVTQNQVMQTILNNLKKISENLEINVLVQGENGTGKEFIARRAHDLVEGKRPFVAVNCAAIPGQLLESVLFGHEKGAFTGAAVGKVGKFELANGGDIFLDEIGTMGLDLQSKLLRVLQEREFERLGSNRIIKSSFRVISATNEDLAELVKQGKFRQDLFYRLKGFVIKLPPLRERMDDFELLLRHFFSDSRVDISKEAMKILKSHDWPGNIRELISLINVLKVLRPDGMITPADLPPAIRGVQDDHEDKDFSSLLLLKVKSLGLPKTMKDLEREIISTALHHSQKKAECAKLLGIPASTLTRKIQEYKL